MGYPVLSLLPNPIGWMSGSFWGLLRQRSIEEPWSETCFSGTTPVSETQTHSLSSKELAYILSSVSSKLRSLLDAYIFRFLLCFLLLFFTQLFVRPPQTAILLFCISFSWGWSCFLSPVQCHEPPSIVHQALCVQQHHIRHGFLRGTQTFNL